MIFQHYRELVRAADAEKWFAITPQAIEAAKAEQKDAERKIVPLHVAAAA